MKIKKPDFLLESEKKMKVMWDLLKNTTAARFRITVTAYPDDGGEPVVVTLEGTRAENGEWNLHHPPRELLGPVGSSSELRDKLNTIEASVQSYISSNSLDEEWRDWMRGLEEVMKSGRTTDDLEYHGQISTRAIAGYGYDAHFFAPVLAMAYVIEGSEALAKGNLEQAARSAERGAFWSREEMLIADPRNRFVGRARTGGGGKAARYAEVKKKVAELLQELQPEGWDSSSQAVDAVADELTANHADLVEERGLQTGNLSRTIKDWLKRAPKRFPHTIKPRE
ncbi:hypothetical protein [Burkholderia pyrrocinia]|uniref:hypothetical protein n=1 Tax=Burkholderia pyrrocinia TaxID=60550 RepID=UPI00158D4272|nr:hypothetical protein [Burkholderia pyrrocinia]